MFWVLISQVQVFKVVGIQCMIQTLYSLGRSSRFLRSFWLWITVLGGDGLWQNCVPVSPKCFIVGLFSFAQYVRVTQPVFKVFFRSNRSIYICIFGVFMGGSEFRIPFTILNWNSISSYLSCFTYFFFLMSVDTFLSWGLENSYSLSFQVLPFFYFPYSLLRYILKLLINNQ